MKTLLFSFLLPVIFFLCRNNGPSETNFTITITGVKNKPQIQFDLSPKTAEWVNKDKMPLLRTKVNFLIKTENPISPLSIC